MDQWITDLAAGHRAVAGRLAERQSQTVPFEDPITAISATGADPLHLALVFNIDHANAMAYANVAATFSPARPNRDCHAARNKHESTPEPTRTVAVTEGEHPVKAAAGCSRSLPI
jgi:hypothetical protein